ncbi:MAG: hypothetical protein V1784_00680 [bacterium]
MSVKSSTLQTTLLKYLDKSSKTGGTRLGYLGEPLASLLPADQRPTDQQIMEAVWSLISQGLAYIDYRQRATENWYLFLTKAGLAAARDEAVNPDNSGEYLGQMASRVREASETVMQYTREAVNSYTSRCYLASTVMLGVASEAAFLEMARSFASWLPNNQGKKFERIIEDRQTNYISKFSEFRKRIEAHKSSIRPDLSDNMSLTMDSVLDLLRSNRNDAGHPTGKRFSRDDAFVNLQMFARYLQRLYELKKFFDSDRSES